MCAVPSGVVAGLGCGSRERVFRAEGLATFCRCCSCCWRWSILARCVSIDAASVSPYGQQQQQYVGVLKDAIPTVDRMPTAASRGHGQHKRAEFVGQLQHVSKLRIVPQIDAPTYHSCLGTLVTHSPVCIFWKTYTARER